MATFINSATNTFTGAGTTMTVNVPAGTLDGHFMMFGAAYSQTPGTVNPPTGWSLISSSTITGCASRWFGRVAASEPANYAFPWQTSNGSMTVAAFIVTYSLAGPIPSAYFTGSQDQVATNSGTTMTSNPASFPMLLGPDILRCVITANGANVATTGPANVLERVQVVAGSAARIYFWEDQRTGDDGRKRATDTLTFTWGSVTPRNTMSAYFHDGPYDSVIVDRFLVPATRRIIVI